MNWIPPKEYLEQSELKREQMEKLSLFVNQLKPTALRDTEEDGHVVLVEVLWQPNAVVTFPLHEVVENEDPKGWADMGQQVRKQIVSGLLEQLMEIDREAVLGYVESILDQEEPARVMARAVKISKEVATAQLTGGTNLQAIMNQDRPTARFKKE